MKWANDFMKGMLTVTLVLCITYLAYLTGNMRLLWWYILPLLIWIDG